jgi:hypothetical protein
MKYLSSEHRQVFETSVLVAAPKDKHFALFGRGASMV